MLIVTITKATDQWSNRHIWEHTTQTTHSHIRMFTMVAWTSAWREWWCTWEEKTNWWAVLVCYRCIFILSLMCKHHPCQLHLYHNAGTDSLKGPQKQMACLYKSTIVHILRSLLVSVYTKHSAKPCKCAVESSLISSRENPQNTPVAGHFVIQLLISHPKGSGWTFDPCRCKYFSDGYMFQLTDSCGHCYIF